MHNDGHDLHHDHVQPLRAFGDLTAGLANHQHAHRKKDRKKDYLQHVAFGISCNRVARNQVDDDLGQRWRDGRDKLTLLAGKLEPLSRADDGGNR